MRGPTSGAVSHEGRAPWSVASPPAEDEREILSFGAWTVRIACRVSAETLVQAPEQRTRAVDLAAGQLASADPVNNLPLAPRSSGLLARRRMLEMTEPNQPLTRVRAVLLTTRHSSC